METCTITQNLQIVKGTRGDYESLAHYHYRESHIGPYAAIFSMKGKFRTATKIETVGVIVYAMPAAGCQMRSAATGGLFAGLDKSSRLKLIGKNIRTVSRVIIEPRFRSLGLAAAIVRETMPLMNVPFIEALAVMGRVNPFFEKAGMTRFDAPPSVGCVRFMEALGAVGIDEQDLIDPRLVQRKIDGLGLPAADFIEREMVLFLQGYGQRRLMPPGIESTRFVLSKLTDRPVYYLWKNPNVELRI
jgi:hypothetical protein